MKKSVIVVLAVLLVASLSMAGGWSYGIKAGLNMASLKLDPSPSGVTVKSRTGVGIGGVFNYNIDNKMDIRTDVLYLMKGAKTEWTGGSGEVKLDYLAIQPTFSYKFAEWNCKLNTSKMGSAFFEVGPEIAMKISAKDKDGNKIEDVKGTDFGLNLGFGINMPLSKGTLVPELRYSMGLAKVLDTGGQSWKTSGIGIMVGYMF